MSAELNPTITAELVLDANIVNAGVEHDVKDFLNNDVFATTGLKTVLNAYVGGRILKATKDGFGLRALGAGQYKGDLFLIFRGTTDKNGNADDITDARIGVCTSPGWRATSSCWMKKRI
jgi:triacylglycerol lipase